MKRRWAFQAAEAKAVYSENHGGAVVFGALSVMGIGAVVLGGYEAVALETGTVPPITWLVVKSRQKHPVAWAGITGALGLALGALSAHFFWPGEIPDWFRDQADVRRRGVVAGSG